MKIIGAPDEWVDLIDTLIPEILKLVISTWDMTPSPMPDAREDPTTEELCRRLRQNRNSGDLPFRIDIQMVELDPGAGEDQGRMDIAFSPLVPREDIYFCLECKRLNVVSKGKTRPYTSEYVTHGMLRFIRGQYSVRVRHGGMLAYVLDGNVNQAIANVDNIVKARSKELKNTIPVGLQNSTVFPDETRLKETGHLRSCIPSQFRVHHFFAGNSA